MVLPTTTYAESTGTFVNNEGRAQRFFAVLEPREGVRDAWRWLRELMRLQGRDEGSSWVTVDDVIADLERELPQFRGVGAAAPGAGWRRHGRKVARQPQRWSGRTAIDAARTVHEPAPVADPDSALVFSLEGLGPADAPAALLPRVWSPGWNSWNGLHKLQEEVDGPLRDGPTGVRLLDGRRRTRVRCRTPTCRAASPLARTSSSSSPHTTSSAPTTSACTRRRSPLERPRRTSASTTPTRRASGLAPGDLVAVWLPWLDARAPYKPVPSLPDGVAAVPVGLPGFPFISLPARGRLSRAAVTEATS